MNKVQGRCRGTLVFAGTLTVLAMTHALHAQTAPSQPTGSPDRAGVARAGVEASQEASSVSSPSLPPTSSLPKPNPEPPKATPFAYDEIVVTAVGDVMLGTTFPDESGGDLPPNDGVGLLDDVAPILKHGDVIFGNLEGPLVDGGVSAKCRGKREGTCYAFRVPTRYGTYLKAAGFNVMGLANNHAMDFGAEGRESSRQVLDAQGIAHSGEVGDIAYLTVKGRKVAILAFATYPNAYNFLDQDDALAEIRKAREESDFLIVSFHGGAEGAKHQHVAAGDETFLGEDRGDLRKFTHAAIDAGAHLVLGSGPHVVRAMEIYNGKLIAYSLGNFATYGPFNLSGENGLSLVLEAHLAPDGTFLRGQVYPVKQEKPGGPKMDPALRIVPILRSLSQSDFHKTGIAVGPRGELLLPGTAIPECSNAPDLLEQPLTAKPCAFVP
jgi:Bacterial capsule synthesis protein PGA_cap